MGKTKVYQKTNSCRGGENYFNSPFQISLIMVVAVSLMFAYAGFSRADSSTSSFKPHPSSGKYSAIACRSTGNNAPIQFSGNAATATRTFLSPSEIIGGNLRSNADIKISGNGFVNGDATPAPGHVVNKTGNATVTGSILPATELLDCSIGDLTQLISWVQQNNNDSSIPPTDQGRMPWGCGSNPPPNDPWQFCLKGNETIHLSGGTYWFSRWNQSGNSKIIVDGYVRILVTGSIGLSGNISINAEGNPYNLLIFAIPDSSFSLQMSGNTIFNGLMYGPSITSQLSGQSTINGNLISQELNASGQAKLKRWIDETAPIINFTKPTGKCLNSNNIEVRLTAIDSESGIDSESISLYLDNSPISFTINPIDSSWHTAEIISSLSNLTSGNHQILSRIWNRAGAYSEHVLNIIIDTTPPVIGITYPADGAPISDSQTVAMGLASDNFEAECGLNVSINGNPIELWPDNQWLTTVNLLNSNRIEAVAIDGAGNTSSQIIYLSAPIIRPLPKIMVPISLTLDDPNHSGVIESGEGAVIVKPSWANLDGSPLNISGHATNWRGPVGPQYKLWDADASYDTIPDSSVRDCSGTNDCYSVEIINSRIPHRDAWLDETIMKDGAPFEYATWTVHMGNSFDDVPTSNLFYKEIETMLHYGITGGCELYYYCPTADLTNFQMAAFIARALAMGDGNIPLDGYDAQHVNQYHCDGPNYHSFFSDILPYQCKYIHYLYVAGIVDDCGESPLKYCPNDTVNREKLAVAIARAIGSGLIDNNIPTTYTDASTGNHYSCDPSYAQCAPDTPNKPYFTDINAASNSCRDIHYLWAKGITGGCSFNPPRYCPAAIATREQAAALIVRAFQLNLYKSSIPDRFFCPKRDITSWGGYEMTTIPNLSIADIDSAVNLMSNYGLGKGFRTFVNTILEDRVYGAFAYKLLPSGKYDLTKTNDDYWDRVDRLMKSSNVAASIRKPVFSLGNVYQCYRSITEPNLLWIGPWCGNPNGDDYNVNTYSQFAYPDKCPALIGKTSCLNDRIDVQKGWMYDWNSSSSCLREWVKCEYRNLAIKLKQKGANVIEIHNEASISQNCGDKPHDYDIDQNVEQAHIDLIKALFGTGIKIQINIEPCKYDGIPYFDIKNFKKLWDELLGPPYNVDYWSLHGLMPDQTTIIPDWMLNSINSDGENVLEISTDGQYRCDPAGPEKASLLHDFAGELLQSVIGLPVNPSPPPPGSYYPGVHFENKAVQLPENEYREIGEIKEVCMNSQKVMADIKAQCSDGPVAVPNCPATIELHWNSINATNCALNNAQVPTSYSEYITINSSTTYDLKCTNAGGAAHDYVTVYCGCNNDGTCDACENHQNCSADCLCGNGICDSGENHQNCSVDCYCGNGTCDPGETPQNCPGDCHPVAALMKAITGDQTTDDCLAHGQDALLHAGRACDFTVCWQCLNASSCSITPSGIDCTIPTGSSLQASSITGYHNYAVTCNGIYGDTGTDPVEVFVGGATCLCDPPCDNCQTCYEGRCIGPRCP